MWYTSLKWSIRRSGCVILGPELVKGGEVGGIGDQRWVEKEFVAHRDDPRGHWSGQMYGSTSKHFRGHLPTLYDCMCGYHSHKPTSVISRLLPTKLQVPLIFPQSGRRLPIAFLRRGILYFHGSYISACTGHTSYRARSSPCDHLGRASAQIMKLYIL